MFDDQTFEALAEFICGDNPEKVPVYRSGSELTRFFERAEAKRFVHDGSTRKWWTKEALKLATNEEITNIIRRLGSPKEYSGDTEKIRKAIKTLNEILQIEGYKILIKGSNSFLEKTDSEFNFELDKDEELKPMPPPDFLTLSLESGIGEILAQRWNEAQLCIDKGAHLSAIVMMGSLLEGLILGVMQKFPKEANQAIAAPRHSNTNKVKIFADWTLSQMIDVAYELEWFNIDIQKFSHALKFFRNLIHPYQQYLNNAFPDEDTCKISWLVVQAAANDLARQLNNK